MNAGNPRGGAEVDRRRFLTIGTLGVGALAAEAASAARSGVAAATRAVENREQPAADTPPGALIDVNVYVSRWPFRRLPGDETPALVAALRSQGVTQAWAGSFDALLHRDIGGVNARLADECRAHGDGLLVPFGTVNPTLPDWEDDLRRCHEEYRMPGIRLHPNYHQYTLADPAFARLLEQAAARSLLVQIALTMEDERTQHPLLQVPHVDTRPLISLARTFPGLRLVLINAFRALRPASLGALVEAENLALDIAMLEGVGGVADLVHRLAPGRVLFGSYAPFFYFESALFKLRESNLEGDELAAVSAGNAVKLMKSQ